MSKFFHRKTVRAFLRYQCCCEFDEIDYYHSVGEINEKFLKLFNYIQRKKNMQTSRQILNKIIFRKMQQYNLYPITPPPPYHINTVLNVFVLPFSVAVCRIWLIICIHTVPSNCIDMYISFSIIASTIFIAMAKQRFYNFLQNISLKQRFVDVGCIFFCFWIFNVNTFHIWMFTLFTSSSYYAEWMFSIARCINSRQYTRFNYGLVVYSLRLYVFGCIEKCRFAHRNQRSH